MKLKEAYQVLNLPENSTPEEAKKKYRQLSKEFHPDINKAPDAEQKFKSINEAYQCVQNGKGNEREDNIPQHSWGGFGNPFGGFQQQVELENIETHISISFKESILGCKKDIKYSRNSKCQECNGHGEIKIDNGCKKCSGKGQVIQRQGHMIMMTSCNECHGKTNTKNCSSCSSQGTINSDISVSISIPPGITDKSILRLQGMGHYAGSFMGMADQHTDAFCHISVEPDIRFSLNGQDVISHLNISLYDALQGCQKTVPTIFGDQNISIPSKSKNNQEVIIPKCGVNKIGSQRVILDVEYPDDIESLLNVLRK